MKFNKDKFNKQYRTYMRNPETKFPCKNGDIVILPQLVRNILTTIKHLTQELDVFMLFVGREGSGKSLFVRQINYVYLYYLKKFGLIGYDFDMSLVHFGIKDLQQDRKDYDSKELKHRISILDESKDDLGRDKHTSPDAKQFIDYMRRCRDESGIISLLMPQLSELMPRITLSRAVFIFEVDYEMNSETGDIIRGGYNCIIIPRGRKGRSFFHNKDLSTAFIKSELSDYLYNNKRQFETLPKSCLFLYGTFNNVDPLNTKAYLDKKREKKWERIRRQDNLKREINRLRDVAQDFKTLVLSLKHDKESNNMIGDRIGKSEASIRRYLKSFDKTTNDGDE